MRILLDENFPVPLMKDFVGHDCSHVIALGWAGTLNGDLLSKAENAGFEVLVTFDDDIPKDHEISERRLAVYVVQPEGQGVPNTRALIAEILVALKVLPGTWSRSCRISHLGLPELPMFRQTTPKQTA